MWYYPSYVHRTPDSPDSTGHAHAHRYMTLLTVFDVVSMPQWDGSGHQARLSRESGHGTGTDWYGLVRTAWFGLTGSDWFGLTGSDWYGLTGTDWY